MPHLPVVNLADLDSDAERTRLRAAAHEVGFFYLSGHGICEHEFVELFEAARRFFALPEADKHRIEMIASPHFRGYTRLGRELTNGREDWREQIDIGPERTAIPGARGYRNLQGPNQWPASLPEFRGAVEAWNLRLSRIGLRLLRAWSVSLGAAADTFDASFADAPATLTKVVRYPGRATDDGDQGVGAHKDAGVLTLLAVQPGTAGLQVEAADGSWIDAPGRPETFIVNIGELLEVATHGYLKATRHRVQSPPIGGERLSVPFFFNPALDAKIPTLALPRELATGVTQDPANPIFDTYGENAWKSRLRAHPDVAAAHGYLSD